MPSNISWSPESECNSCIVELCQWTLLAFYLASLLKFSVQSNCSAEYRNTQTTFPVLYGNRILYCKGLRNTYWFCLQSSVLGEWTLLHRFENSLFLNILSLFQTYAVNYIFQASNVTALLKLHKLSWWRVQLKSVSSFKQHKNH